MQGQVLLVQPCSAKLCAIRVDSMSFTCHVVTNVGGMTVLFKRVDIGAMDQRGPGLDVARSQTSALISYWKKL